MGKKVFIVDTTRCTGCAHLIDEGWEVPRCVEACPTQALIFGDREGLSELIGKAEQLHPEYGTNPSVYYIGLPKTFVAGSVYCSESGECIENAQVTLVNKLSGETFITKTNNYGDFEFDGVEVDLTCSLKIMAEGYYPLSIDDIYVKEDISLGNIYLVPALFKTGVAE